MTVFWIQQRKAPTDLSFYPLMIGMCALRINSVFRLFRISQWKSLTNINMHRCICPEFNLSNVFGCCCCSTNLLQKMQVNTKETKFCALIPVLLVLSTVWSKPVTPTAAVRSSWHNGSPPPFTAVLSMFITHARGKKFCRSPYHYSYSFLKWKINGSCFLPINHSFELFSSKTIFFNFSTSWHQGKFWIVFASLLEHQQMIQKCFTTNWKYI